MDSKIDCVKHLKETLEFQSFEIQGLVASNDMMVDALAKTGGVPVEKLVRDLTLTAERTVSIKRDISRLERKVPVYERINEQMESLINNVYKLVKDNVDEAEASSPIPDRKAEAEEESEAGANKLLACIAEEKSKVEKLSVRLADLGEDVYELLYTEIPEEEEENKVSQESEELEGDAAVPLPPGEEEENKVSQESGEELEGDAAVPLPPGEEEENKVSQESGEELEDDAAVPPPPGEEEENKVSQESGEELEDDAAVSEESKEFGDWYCVDDPARTVEQLLDCISNRELADDRRNAMVELMNVLAYSSDASVVFLAKGLSLVMSVLKEERDDGELVRSALGVLNNAMLNRIPSDSQNEEARSALTNVDMLSRDADSVSLLLSYLGLDDFCKDDPFRILNGLVENFPNSLPETLLAIPDCMTRLVEMLMDDNVEFHLPEFLTRLIRQSEEILKVVVSEDGVYKTGRILRNHGSEDSRLVEESLKLLISLLYNNPANQKVIKESHGFDILYCVFELQDDFIEQKWDNILMAFEIVNILITEDSEADLGDDYIDLTNRTTLVEKNIFKYLLILATQTRRIPSSVRCLALRCIGDLIRQHPKNIDALASEVFEEEPALIYILRFLFTTSNVEEFLAADNVFKSLCEKNSQGQAMLASTLVSQPQPVVNEDSNMPFGSVLLGGFRGLETSCRAASILAHILEGNIELKEKALEIKFMASVTDGVPESLMQRIVKHLALSSLVGINAGEPSKSVKSYFRPIVLKLLAIWFADCPDAVKSFLDSPPGLVYLLELLSDESESACTKGLADLILGQCVIFNVSLEGLDAFAVVRIVTQKAGLTSYFLKLDEMQKDKNRDDPVLSSIFDSNFVTLKNNLEADIRGKLVELSSQPKSDEPVVPAKLEQKSDETEAEYSNRLKESVAKQCTEIKDLLARSAVMANTAGILTEMLVGDLREKSRELKRLKLERDRAEFDVAAIREFSDELESALNKINATFDGFLTFQIKPSEFPNIDALKANARTNSLSAWLGREKSGVEKLTARLSELGEDVEKSA